ncbi:bifunctional adenosylcobinamide kinase/adenosylcobinamide-phosphate guanylyltransferase [Bacillus sp. FJAT-47783]|uniref:bifunctional adenosylcobinamide kinase/adenosylcobinamide-phosphate guanylyltransferase n=1 Tax=Bacillus sp. FJAT-47783 TaxID=2922712 RepID=UPI001FAD87FF
MHFVTGGAFNGKRKWVKQHVLKDNETYSWISGYEKKCAYDWIKIESFQTITVIEGVEQFLYDHLEREDWKSHWLQVMHIWEKWEREDSSRSLILIGTDMTKGIVPLEAKERLWRDVSGWCFQDIVKRAERVDIIWYGINERIK